MVYQLKYDSVHGRFAGQTCVLQLSVCCSLCEGTIAAKEDGGKEFLVTGQMN